MAATKHSGNTIVRMALERRATSSRLMNRTRANAPHSRRRSCDASQPRSFAMRRDRERPIRRRRRQAIGTTSRAITATTAVRPSMAASASSRTAAGAGARSISRASDFSGAPGNSAAQMKKRGGKVPAALQLLSRWSRPESARSQASNQGLAGDPSEVTALRIRHWITSFHC